MKVITFTISKGGVGKSTMAYNFAGLESKRLAKKKKGVLVIDADSQANLSALFNISQDVDVNDEEYPNLSNVLLDDIKPEDVIMTGLSQAMPNVDLIAGHVDLTAAQSALDILKLQGVNNITRLKAWIDKNYEYLSSKYETVICDVGPFFGSITQNCLYASDEIFLVVEIAESSFRGAKLFMVEWEKVCDEEKIDNNIKGIIVNKFDKRTSLSKEFADFLVSEDRFHNKIFDTLVPYTVKFQRGELEGKPLCFYEPSGVQTKELNALYKEMRKKGFL